MRVMVIDASKTMRKIQVSLLEQMGCTDIEEASNSQEAFSKLDTFEPDLLIVDWNMPSVDGLTFVRTYRAQGHDTPIIMVTTENQRARVIEAIRAGVNSYVVKPFTPELLKGRIEEIMPKEPAA